MNPLFITCDLWVSSLSTITLWESMKTIPHPFLTSFSISEWTSHISAFLWLSILNDTRTAWPAPPWAGLCQILEEMLFMWRCKKNEMKRHFKFNFQTHKRKYIFKKNCSYWRTCIIVESFTPEGQSYSYTLCSYSAARTASSSSVKPSALHKVKRALALALHTVTVSRQISSIAAF